MLEHSARMIEEHLREDATVLDVGGAARPFARADWVLDILPYAARGELGWDGERGDERFDETSWVRRDVCDREPWPFADRQFDFAVCSQTLEDVRDPVFVCSELQRVAAAGYIEVPSVDEELTFGIQGPWVGWGNHRWIALVEPGRIEFAFKHHVVNREGSHLPAGSVDEISATDRTQTLWWEDSFKVRERFMRTTEELDEFLEGLVAQGPPDAPPGRVRGILGALRHGGRADAGS